MMDFSVANVVSVGHPAQIFGSEADSYFRHLMENPDIDIAGHNPIFMSEVAKLPAGAVIFDVGANIGLTVIAGARLVPLSRVIAVEPSPLAFAALSRMIEANGLTNCHADNLCIGSSFGTVPFVENGAFIAGSYVGSQAKSDGAIHVPMTTLDSLVMKHALDRLDLVKIDVEGYELDVLQGAIGTIDKFNPVFVMEFNSFALTANRNLSPRALLDFILDRFGSFKVNRNGEELTISSPEVVRDFIYGNMTAYGCVEDLIFGGDS